VKWKLTFGLDDNAGCTAAPVDTLFHTLLTDGAWRGGRCFIVAGGPSARGFDFSRLRGERTIAVNRAFEAFDPTIWFSTDPRLVCWIESGAFGAAMRDRFLGGAGLKCLVPTSGEDYSTPVPVLLPWNRGGRLSESMRQGIFSGTADACNSALGALNLALCLGADPIYLLGFDMRTGPAGEKNWYPGEYPVREDSTPYNAYLRAFDSIAAEALRRSRIVNLNPESALRCFPFGSMDDVREVERPLVVSCGSETRTHVLRRSLRGLGLESEIGACGSKADFLDAAQRRDPARPLLYVSERAELRRYPALFDNAAHDFAAHFAEDGRMRTETLFVHGGPRGRRVVEAWVSANRGRPGSTEEENLARVVRTMRDRGEISVLQLPPAYCAMATRSGASPGDAVILHRAGGSGQAA
jgi:hypothetical protein